MTLKLIRASVPLLVVSVLSWGCGSSTDESCDSGCGATAASGGGIEKGGTSGAGAGSPAGGSLTGGAPAGGAPAGGNTMGTGGSETPTGPDPSGLPTSYKPKTFVFEEREDGVACSGASNPSATIGKAYFAQTHALSPGHPLFFLIASRPALLEVHVTGTGAAPEISVKAQAKGSTLGTLCLAGPRDLPASIDDTVHRRDDRYTVTLPSAWLTPGLSIEIKAGNATLTYSAEELGVGHAPEMNLVMVPTDVLNYNEAKEDVEIPADWLGNYAGAIPASVLRFARFPTRVPLPVLAGSADDDGDGVPPELLTVRPCQNGETADDGCVVTGVTPGYVNGAVLRVISALHLATGDFSFSYYYGNTANFFDGGWGGGKNHVCADVGGVFIHEMGHALSLPHWGQGAYQNTTPSEDDYRYPYGGVGSDGGGRGGSWNYYQNINEYVSPTCEMAGHENAGEERSDGMQRNNQCDETRTAGRGPWDGFGDFSALAMFRYMTGGDASAGTVPYRGGDATYHLSRQGGWPNLVLNDDGSRSLVRSALQPAERRDEEKYDFLVPVEWDVPVVTVYGSFHPSESSVNILYEPLAYVGNLPKVLDPTNPETFDYLLAGGEGPYEGYFYWPKDLTIKVTYADGEVMHGIYPHGSFPRDFASNNYGGPWRQDLVYFALTFPGNKVVSKVELFERPFVVRGAGSNDPGNINNAAQGITAANFMVGARLATTWQR